MKIEGLVGRTMRAQPAGESAAMALAARASLVRPGPGGWIVLPLGLRVLSRVSALLLRGLDCQPVSLLVPAGQDPAAILSGLIRGETQSYRQLPLRIATLWPGWGPDLLPEPHAMASGSFGVAGAFTSEDALDAFIGRVHANLVGLMDIAGVELGAEMGFDRTSAAMAYGANDPVRALGCAECGRSYLHDAAPFVRDDLERGAPRPMERVETPGASTIQALAEMLGVDRKQTLKALFFSTEVGGLVFAVTRGDLDANLEKLARVTGAVALRPATEAEIVAADAVAGYASPIGLRVRTGATREGVRVIADLSVYTGCDFVAGANAPDHHFMHVDPRRDFVVTEVADIALPPAGARCAACGSPLKEKRGTIVARTSPLGAPVFSNVSGAEERGAAAWTRVDLIAVLECLTSACADEVGIAWPPSVAPAEIHVVSLKEDDACRSTVGALEACGLSVLCDDRPIGAGAKFTDADLIGCPLRVTVSSRSLQAGGVEVAGRRAISPEVVPISELPSRAKARLAALMSS